MKKAIYAGSFDPFHNGHLSIVKKALKIVDHLIIVVANNPEKTSSPINQRYENLKLKLRSLKAISIKKMETGLIANFAKKENVKILIRSARNNNDFEFEIMMAVQNKRLNQELETILVMPDQANVKIRSSILPKEYN